MKTKVWLPIAVIAALLLAAGAGYAFLYRPVEQVYSSAVEKAGTAPYDEAQQALADAAEALDGRTFAEERAADLKARQAELAAAEIERAIGAGELAHAAELLEDSDPDRARALREELAAREKALAEERERKAREEAYEAALALEQAGKDREAADAFLAMGGYSDAAERAEAIQARIAFREAEAVFTGTNYDEGIAALTALGTAEGQEAAEELQKQKTAWFEARREEYSAAAAGRITAGAWHTAVMGETPLIAGDSRYGSAPDGPDAVFSGISSVFYVKDGRVYHTGETFGAEKTVAELTGVKKVAPGLVHCLFLHEDGTVTMVGSRALDRFPKKEWTGMTDVAAGAWHSLGLNADGTVAACGTNDHGQCDVDGWQDVVCVSAGLWHSVGLKADGTVAACGDNTYGQCGVQDWTDIVAVSCGACTTVGLKADGTVVACGDNAAGQCDVAGWKDIAAIAAGSYHTVGLGLDGRLVTAGAAPAALPQEPLFASEWTTGNRDAGPEEKTATAYIQGRDDALGPWLYMDDRGIALVCIDRSGERAIFRADMLATSGALPGGRVTDPSASGDYIRMPAEIPADQARKNHAVLAFTGDYVGYTSNRKGIMMRNGIVYYDRPQNASLAVMPDGTLKYYNGGETSAARLMEMGVRDCFSFGPLFVSNGERKYWNSNKKDLFTTRVAFGYTDPYHYIALVTLRERQTAMSLTKMTELLMSLGCRTGYNMDGGHSTSLVFMGRELSLIAPFSGQKFSNIRGLSDIIVFLENETVG